MNSITNLKYWGYFLLPICLLCIVVATISPFNFVIPQGFSGQYIINEFKFGSNVKDYWQNILLFIPYGFSLATIINRHSQQKLLNQILFTCLIYSFTLSLTVEITQFFLPSRDSNITDIFYNSIGGILGGILSSQQSKITKFIIAIATGNIASLSLKSIAQVLLLYCTLIILATTILFNSINLNNWDNSYLSLGNEIYGKRSWRGYLKSISLRDYAFGLAEVKAALSSGNTITPESKDYSFISAASFDCNRQFYRDRANILPDLYWQGNQLEINCDRALKDTAPHKAYPKGNRALKEDATHKAYPKGNRPQGASEANRHQSIFLSHKQWLKSEQQATKLINRLKETDEFTLNLSLASDNLNLEGYKRIFALSSGVSDYNLILAQEKKDLYIRLRTPLSGSNAAAPELIVPDVFLDNNFHQLIVVFSERKITCYLDQVEHNYSFTFNPDILFVVFFPWHSQTWQINLRDFSPREHQLAFYLTVFLPPIFLAIIFVYRLTLSA